MWTNYSFNYPQYPDSSGSLPVEINTPANRYTAIDDLTKQIEGINNYNSVFSSTDEQNIPSTNNSTTDITDLLTGDKLRFLEASARLFQQQITSRTRIKDENIYRLDHKILECSSYLTEMDFIPPFVNPMVEAKRANLSHTINRMESEKNQEVARCWSDQVRLYSELLKILGDIQTVERRSKILTGDIK
ncbi:MAG: hypothetical protein H8E14_11905 [Candidatus Marinimicrobia bacterium]|nr:hypothetical protein [Candidatus Neomarinimicrobiota bacterium]